MSEFEEMRIILSSNSFNKSQFSAAQLMTNIKIQEC